ncbi:MAG: trypsin-like peptidase domain-containing protein, partial [Pseudomonadota bacterium]
ALRTEGAVSYISAGWQLRHPPRAALALSPAPAVTGLAPDGPAALAGIEEGDRVARIGDRQIRSLRDAVAALALIGPQQPSVEVTLLSEGAERRVLLPLGPEAAAPAPQEPGECPHPAPVCLARQAVFPVTSFDPVGSAVRIAPDLLVTNRHVVGDRADAVVHTPDGPRGAEVLPSAYRGDLALLRVEGLPDGALILSPEPDAAGQQAAGQGPFFAIGADIARQEVRVFEPGGVIAPPAEGAALGRLHVSAHMQPGVSGGALVDAAGQLAGIATGGGEGRFEAIPLRDVPALLDGLDDPDAGAVHAALGAALVACAEALESWQPGSGERAPLAETCAGADNAGQLLEAGRLLAQSGAFAEGADLHARAVAQVPNSLNARLSLLVSLQLGGRFEEMLPHARRVMELAPDDPQALRFAIQAGVWGGDPALAEAGYTALLAADPRQAQAARRFIDDPPPAPPRR